VDDVLDFTASPSNWASPVERFEGRQVTLPLIYALEARRRKDSGWFTPC